MIRGFNEALNGFSDEGWTLLGNDGMDDVTILVNSNPEKMMGLNISFTNEYNSICNTVLCAKASMLLQVVYFKCFNFQFICLQENMLP